MTAMPSVRLRAMPALIPVNGKNVELQSTDDYIQWRNVGDASWQNLLPLTEITGPAGPQGPSGSGVPAGGTTGQVLVKTSNSDGAVGWTAAGTGDVQSINNLSDLSSLGLGRKNIEVPRYVADRAALKAVSTSADTTVVTVGGTRPTTFRLKTGDYSTAVANDPAEAFTVKANDSSASTKAWVSDERIVKASSFGAALDGVTDDSVAIQRAVNYCHLVYPTRTLDVDGMARIVTPINIDRPIDGATVADWFHIISSTGGGFVRTTDGSLFTSSIAFTTQPVSQTLNFTGIKFVSSTTGPRYVMNDARFIRVVFDGCTFDKMRYVNATIYTQSIYFSNCNIRYWNGTFYNSPNGAYDIKFNPGNLMEHGGDGFILGDETAGRAVAGCSFIGSVIEGLAGTPIRYGGARGLTISGMYFEANAGPDINSNYFGSAAPSRGVFISGNLFAQKASNLADPNYTSIVWGNNLGAISTGNFSDGRLHLLGASSDVEIRADRSLVATIHASSAQPASGSTQSWVEYHNGSAIVRQRVTVGAADSGGAGFKLLRVPN